MRLSENKIISSLCINMRVGSADQVTRKQSRSGMHPAGFLNISEFPAPRDSNPFPSLLQV